MATDVRFAELLMERVVPRIPSGGLQDCLRTCLKSTRVGQDWEWADIVELAV